ncbi:hypothetical protein A2J03_21125 [Rhodococcus sp. EPR-157]|uniref:helix-turn-helix domain-containing protein n=1 Tax=Rhodococcus sp. EPR-157 TaxID=1813677 RepID=UPI0007BC5D55|nr:helix-turn-helix domain-containing protein [Rhodococcus sp. EPR-157]KZF08474.1 hypothetical protein A2J03_21125 [Rhodococcus sp. EPR-157]
MTYTPGKRTAARRQRILDCLAAQHEPVNTAQIRARFGSTERAEVTQLLAELVAEGTVTRTEYQPPIGRGGFKYELSGKVAR